jgi:hypothetical protein
MVSAVPIPGLPVDRLVTWQELAPDRLEAAIAEAAQRGAVLRLSAAGLAQDAPETFPTAKAAEQWLARDGKDAVNTPAPLIIYTIRGMGVLNPVRVRFKLLGQRGPHPTPALVILPGNPRELAEAQLGPLAMFELVDPPEPVTAEIVPHDDLVWARAGQIARETAEGRRWRAARDAERLMGPAVDHGGLALRRVPVAAPRPALRPQRRIATMPRLDDPENRIDAMPCRPLRRYAIEDGGLDAPKNADKAFLGFCRKWFEK